MNEKKFRLDGTNGMLLGTCAGLANLSGINVIVVRIGMIVLAIVGSLFTVIAYGIAGLFVHPRPKFAPSSPNVGIISMSLGAILAAGLFVFVSNVSMLGVECYYVGKLTPSTACIRPPIYRAAWVLAVILVAWGAWMYSKSQNK